MDPQDQNPPQPPAGTGQAAPADRTAEPELPLVTPAFDPLTEPELPLSAEGAPAEPAAALEPVEPAASAQATAGPAQPPSDVAQATADSSQPAVDAAQAAADSTQPPADATQATVDATLATADAARATAGTEHPTVNTAQAVAETAQAAAETAHDTVDTGPKPALPMQKTTPSWAKPDMQEAEPAAAVASVEDAEPKAAVPMQKPVPVWAQTVPAPAEPAAEPEPTPPAPPVKSDPLSWPPRAQGEAAASTQKDMWPPEPPTEPAMPAWPPKMIEDAQPHPASTSTQSTDSEWNPAAAVAPSAPPASVPPAVSAPPATTAPPAAASTAAEPGTASHVSAFPAVGTKGRWQSQSSRPPDAQTPTSLKEAAAAPKEEPASFEQVSAKEPAEPEEAPSWAPTLAMPKKTAESTTDWPGVVEVPAWAPHLHIDTGPAPAPPPVAEPPKPAAPAVPVEPPTPQRSADVPAPAPSRPPPAPEPAAPSASQWAVVEQKRIDAQKISRDVPSPEDRSYAEWFAWAKRGGAPAGACHAAAQAAFEALAGGKDVAVAAQLAAAAMAMPPLPVDAGRQTYCAWFSLGNIDLAFDQRRAHAFATAAVHKLDAGGDAKQAHAAGLDAAGIK